MRWGERGKGHWITVYTNPGHAYVVIAGLRLDTSVGDRSTPRRAPHAAAARAGASTTARRAGFRARHPSGY